MRRDSYAGEDGGYQVVSLYYDTPWDKALREKLDGVPLREKFRLRRYGDNTSLIKLEKKYKVNGLCGKISAALTYQETRQLIEKGSGVLAGRGEPVVREFCTKLRTELLRPRVIVSYYREAFTLRPGNTRVTLDRDVRTQYNADSFLRPDGRDIPPEGRQVILEVKYDGFLPDIVRIALQGCTGQHMSISKYTMCRRLG